ncbi:hypothetical protein WJX74_004738 [Apatococcus lobatus]|uniref:Uncharacterized protein n=1 Tax=Apatococcus lobatus TaxID=904363 RepID=A0AAW1RHR8_9CHLO
MPREQDDTSPPVADGPGSNETTDRFDTSIGTLKEGQALQPIFAEICRLELQGTLWRQMNEPDIAPFVYHSKSTGGMTL